MKASKCYPIQYVVIVRVKTTTINLEAIEKLLTRLNIADFTQREAKHKDIMWVKINFSIISCLSISIPVHTFLA